jgi:hypothetical protein
MKQIDTTINGFKYVGINLTEQQYEDLCDLNALILMNNNRKNIPVFNIMLVLRILNLLPDNMMTDIDYKKYNDTELLQLKFGKIID